MSIAPKKTISSKSKKLANLKLLLTKRESEIALCLCSSMTYKEISKGLFIAESTIRKHASNIFAKLEIKNRREFIVKYPNLKEHLKAENYRLVLDEKLSEIVDLSWKDDNHFGHYYEELSEVIEAMCQMDFSKRLPESNDKKSLINFIAQSLNMVNDELESNYIEGKLMAKILALLNVQNRIVLLSKDRSTISHYYDTRRGKIIQGQRFIGESIDQFIPLDQIQLVNSERSITFNSNVQFDNVKNSLKTASKIHLELLDGILVATIDTPNESHIEDQLPRILSLLSCIKSQYEDNPHLADSVLGKTVSTEINGIFKNLDLFIFHKD